MTLFRRHDNTPIKFDIIGLSDEEYEVIKKIVSVNGGTVEHCHEQPIKFIKTYMFIGCAFPAAKLYSINFITDCVDNGRIMDPTPYRIGISMMYDDYIMTAFLHGSCAACTEFLYHQELLAILSHFFRTYAKRTLSTRSSLILSSFENKHSRKRTRLSRNQEFASPSASRESCDKIAVRESLSNKSTTSESASSLTSDTESVNSDTSCSQSQNSVERMNRGKRGRGFTFAEEKSMVMYLVDNDLIGEAKSGVQVWQMAIINGVCSERAVPTLYNRFRQKILPNIESFGLTNAQLQEFQKLRDN